MEGSRLFVPPLLKPNLHLEVRSPKVRKIRFGLYTIKNLGTDTADAIIAERKTNGKFKSITDFLDRIKHKNLNKKSMEALIKSGSMDEWGDRGVFLLIWKICLPIIKNLEIKMKIRLPSLVAYHKLKLQPLS